MRQTPGVRDFFCHDDEAHWIPRSKCAAAQVMHPGPLPGREGTRRSHPDPLPEKREVDTRGAQARTGMGWRARNGALASAIPRGSLSSSAWFEPASTNGSRRRSSSRVTELHCPCGGCQSSTLLPSGSMTHPNFPYSESSVFSSTLQPSSRSALRSAARSSTR